MFKTSELRIRDPYVVVWNGAYYMYCSGGQTGNCGNSVVVYKSFDLENWGEEKIVYTLSENSWATRDLWAPEVHLYNGKYYMFLSLLGRNGLRGTEISVSDTPDGAFVPISDRAVTPAERSCIDGTLYVENGTPYIVYSFDWPDNYIEEKGCYVGEIWALQLTEDLREAVGNPFLLFRSDEAPCSEPHLLDYYGETAKRYGSDAPFLQRLSDGTLYLTWSPYPVDRYIVASAISENGSIRGKWKHQNEPLFDRDGGHAMFFEALDGTKKICMHYPEKMPFERPLFLNTKEENGRLKLDFEIVVKDRQ